MLFYFQKLRIFLTIMFNNVMIFQDVNGNSLPLLLVLGYAHGIQEFVATYAFDQEFYEKIAKLLNSQIS